MERRGVMQDVGGGRGKQYGTVVVYGGQLTDGKNPFDGMRYNNLNLLQNGGGAALWWKPNQRDCYRIKATCDVYNVFNDAAILKGEHTVGTQVAETNASLGGAVVQMWRSDRLLRNMERRLASFMGEMK